jgi:hypothetical protein
VIRCPTCGFDGPREDDFWCGDCGDWIGGDSEIEREMETDAMLLDLLGGAYDEQPELKEKVKAFLIRECAR